MFFIKNIDRKFICNENFNSENICKHVVSETENFTTKLYCDNTQTLSFSGLNNSCFSILSYVCHESSENSLMPYPHSKPKIPE